MTADATDTRSGQLGLTFRETMSGGFAMNETDPAAGEKKGDEDKTRMAMHGTITIDDLDRFLSNPDHPGQLVGSIDFPSLGTGLPSTKGIFNLFSPTTDPKMKYMVYELGFVSGGQEYYMAGRKEVHDDPGIDFWRDVTTLYTRLHRGSDKNGPIVGAGILSLSLSQLGKLVPTMHVTGEGSAADKAKALTRFGTFFLGQMWHTYVADKLGGK